MRSRSVAVRWLKSDGSAACRASLGMLLLLAVGGRSAQAELVAQAEPAPQATQATQPTAELAAQLRTPGLGRVLPSVSDSDQPAVPATSSNRLPTMAEARQAVQQDTRTRLRQGGREVSAEWYKVGSPEQWQAFYRPKLASLRASLSLDPLPTEPRNLRTLGRVEGDGYRIENMVFETRPGVEVTANLYLPTEPPPGGRGPGIVICHSHHTPKAHGELQAMGMTWARQGAVVLVMDQLGHGERRTHAFATPEAYAGTFRPGRQDYYFRYNTGVQLNLVGESLMGWMAGDLICGVSLLAARPDVDPQRLMLMGAVAGGGDPAGVVGALDERLAVVVPFNFGGYEPEYAFPLPEDTEETFNYTGSGSWESTRGLRLSVRDGFLPWVMVGSAIPRKVIYAHEFRWDEERDPVWKRFRTIAQWYGADCLGTVVGRGTVRERTATHCTHIGAVHRAQIYPLLAKWCQMPVPESEYLESRPFSELMCYEQPREFALHTLLGELAQQRLAAARASRQGDDLPAVPPLARQRQGLRQSLAPLVGNVEPEAELPRLGPVAEPERLGSVVREALVLQGRGGVPLPLTLLSKAETAGQAANRVVVAFAQEGKEALLAQRAEQMACFLDAGALVVLVDLRGMGETAPERADRGHRNSGATSRSATEWMLGQTMLAHQVSDLRGVLRYLRAQQKIGSDAAIVLYADSFAPANPLDRPIAAPLDAEDLPRASEPGAALVALLAGLWEDDIAAIHAGGALVSFGSLLESPYFYVPHDALIPGVLAEADMADLLAAQQARLWLADLRTGANQPVGPERQQALLVEVQGLRGRGVPPLGLRIMPAAGTSAADSSSAEWCHWLLAAPGEK